LGKKKKAAESSRERREAYHLVIDFANKRKEEGKDSRGDVKSKSRSNLEKKKGGREGSPRRRPILLRRERRGIF